MAKVGPPGNVAGGSLEGGRIIPKRSSRIRDRTVSETVGAVTIHVTRVEISASQAGSAAVASRLERCEWKPGAKR